MLRVVVDRMLTMRDTRTFSACLVFVQNFSDDVPCGGGCDGGRVGRQPERVVTRELMEKCVLMLNLAGDEADAASCASTVLRFFVSVLNERSARRRGLTLLSGTKIVHAVCALLLRSGDGAANVQVVELCLDCILKAIRQIGNIDWCRILVEGGYVPLIVTFVTHERDVIRHSALAIVAQLIIDKVVADFVLCQLLTRLGYCVVGTDDKTLSRVLLPIVYYRNFYGSSDMLHMATDFHLMPYVMTLLESHNCQTVVSSLCLTDAVIHARRHIIAPSLRNECVIRIFQLFTAQLEETHSNFGTDVHVLILREFSRVSYNSLPAIQD